MSTQVNCTRLDPSAALSHLAIEVGSEFEFNADGECELLFDNRLPVMLRREEDDAMTLGVCVAHNVTADETDLLARLMAYQWLGRSTRGFLLSWNDQAGTIVLSHRIECACFMTDLREPLEHLLERAHVVQHDILALLEAGLDRVPHTLTSTETIVSSPLRV